LFAGLLLTAALHAAESDRLGEGAEGERGDTADSAAASEGPRAPGLEERVEVTAELRESPSAPIGASSTLLEPEEIPGTPSNVTDLVVATPGVSQNGQGGLFQVFSVRGVSRQRVMNLVSGMRINSDRRAGASISFVDPLLMNTVEVQRGPSTTFHGSGALGGVVQVLPQDYDGTSLHLGYDTRGNENYQVVGHGTDTWSFGFARRDAGDTEAPDGTKLNSHFTQYSSTLARRWTAGKRRYEVLFIPTRAEDVGKSNSDFPTRTTDYPLERHHLLKFAIDAESGWKFHGWVHDYDLETEVTEGASVAHVENESLDYGLRWEKRDDATDTIGLRWGFQGVGRYGVNASETGSPSTLDDAREFEAGAFAAASVTRARFEYEGGLRLSRQHQKNANSPGETLSALNAFAGAVRRIGRRVELRGSVSSGLRFPSLSERFFTGTTGAGGVIGNPNLEEERSLNAEGSARWVGRRVLVQASLFHNEIEDYIERVDLNPDLDPDLKTFINLVSGTLQGAEMETMLQPAPGWNLTVGGHVVRGRGDSGLPLADVPPWRYHVGLHHRREAWLFDLRVTHRGPKTDPGPGEVRRDSANELSAAVGRGLSRRWDLVLTGTNLLDEEYFAAADRRAPLVAQRSVGLRAVRRMR
jgi:iron complex outermembrane receptor protein